MLHNRLSQLFQKESDRLLKSFLGENQDLLKKYVEGGVAVVGTVLKPVNSFMRHLLVVQGLDPDTAPGESQRLLTLQALTSFFESKHDKDFDDDYDLSWVAQKFEKTRGALKDLKLTQDKFMELTDLSKLGSGRYPTADEEQEIFRTRTTPEPDKRELNVGDKPATFDPGNAIQQLKEFVENLEEKKVGIKTTKKKLNKGKRVGSGPRVQRIANTEPLKEGPSTLRVDSDRKERLPTKIAGNRNLKELAQEKKSKNKAILESTPEFKAQAAAKLARATELTNLMVKKDLCEADYESRQNQINSMLNWHDNNFDSLERVINRHKPTKDAIAENKFTGSFKRVQK